MNSVKLSEKIPLTREGNKLVRDIVLLFPVMIGRHGISSQNNYG